MIRQSGSHTLSGCLSGHLAGEGVAPVISPSPSELRGGTGGPRAMLNGIKAVVLNGVNKVRFILCGVAWCGAAPRVWVVCMSCAGVV